MSALPLIQEKESVSVPVVVEFLEEDGVYMVSVPWLQGCHAWGDTLDEALRAIPDNIRAMLEARHAHGDPLPPPSRTWLSLFPSPCLKPGTLRTILRDLGIDPQEISRR